MTRRHVGIRDIDAVERVSPADVDELPTTHEPHVSRRPDRRH
jgi:hypothetical protein